MPRPPLLARLLRALERRYDAVQHNGAGSVRGAFRERLAALGSSLSLRLPGTDETLSGTVQGITETGALRLRTADGVEKTVHAGEVTTRR